MTSMLDDYSDDDFDAAMHDVSRRQIAAGESARLLAQHKALLLAGDRRMAGVDIDAVHYRIKPSHQVHGALHDLQHDDTQPEPAECATSIGAEQRNEDAARSMQSHASYRIVLALLLWALVLVLVIALGAAVWPA